MVANAIGDIESVVRHTIDRLTYDGFLFTALDVSNTVKTILPGVRHREVAPIVRDIFTNGEFGDGYTRTLIDVIADGRKKVSAFLYHLDDDDPEDYAGSQRQQLAVAPIPVQQQQAALASSAQCTVEIGRDGRARIERAFLAQAGLNGPTVQVELDGNGVFLRLLNPSGNPVNRVLASLQFNHPTVLHLPLAMLQSFDLTKPLYAKIEGPEVVIRP